MLLTEDKMRRYEEDGFLQVEVSVVRMNGTAEGVI